MNPQRNLIQQMAGLKEVPVFFRWGRNNASARATLEAGSIRVQNAIDDCLLCLTSIATRFDIKEKVPKSKLIMSALERTKRNLQRLITFDIYFTWQAKYYIDSALSPIERLMQDYHWGDMSRAYVLQFEDGNIYQRIDVYNSNVYFCRTLMDATLVFTQVEVDIIAEALQLTPLHDSEFQVRGDLGFPPTYAMQNDVGNMVRPRAMAQRWYNYSDKILHKI